MKKGLGKQRVGKQTSGQSVKGEKQIWTEMPRTGGYRRSAVWRPCGVTPHTALQNKSRVVCSGSRVTISTVMKLRWSVKQGGINVETYTKSTCSQSYSWGYVTTPHWWTVVGSMGLLLSRCQKLRCNQTLKWPSVPLIIMHGFQPSKFQMSGSSDSFCLVPLAASFFSLSSSPSCLWSCLRECEVSQVSVL